MPTPEEAADEETEWFAQIHSLPAWRDLGPGLSEQFGIPNLTVKLSQILNDLNQKS